ncbi:MAG TPA: phage major capsid protein [Chloroflexi bacterium]|nr:phage major capsid protein [Chloroflexota bacterium]
MAYNDAITRTDADALIEESVANQIFESMATDSMIMRLGTRLADMPAHVHRLPVLSLLPTAYFVNGDSGLKQTTKMAWENKYITAEEIAAIIPIPEAVIDDASYPIWDQVRPQVAAALARVFDSAVLFGVNAPSTWPGGLFQGTVDTSHVVNLGDITTDPKLYTAIFDEGGVLAKVEDSGYLVSGHIGAISLRAKLRGLRDTNGNPLFVRAMQEGTRYELDGEPIEFPRNGAWLTSLTYSGNTYTNPLLISGDFTQLVWSFRQGLRWKLLDQAVIQDGSGNIIYNLAQQDMVALRVTVRLGWQLPNPVNPVDGSANRYPFAALAESVAAAA